MATRMLGRPARDGDQRRSPGPARLLAVAAVALAGAVAAGCGGPTTAVPTASTTTTTLLTPPLLRPSVTIGGHSFPVPTEVPGKPIDPAVDTGGQIVLTAKGFLPFRLFVSLKQPIVWTNLTATPVRIWFEHSTVASRLIRPGGTFTYTSSTLYTFVYRSSTGYHGIAQIGSFP